MDDTSTLPWKQLLVICFCRFLEPLSYTIHVPFIYFMIKNFNMTTEENIGYYCGLLLSTMSMTSFIAGIPLGLLSDRIGRKPVILLGLTSISLSLLFFGLGKSFAWLITVKFLSGLMNGNAAILKSMVAEITQNYSASKKTQAFLFFQFFFEFGLIVGTALGGYLSEPVTKYPKIFKKGIWITDLLEEYPYFLPCFVAFIISAVGWILCLFKMEETLIKDSYKNQSEETPLLQQDQQQHKIGSPRFTILNKNHSLEDILTPATLLICAVYFLASFQVEYFVVLFPTWSSTPIDKGGLGFKPSEIGALFSYSSAAMFTTQLLLLYRLTKRWSMVRIIQFLLITSLFVPFIIGLFRIPYFLINGETTWIWFGLLLSMTIQSAGESMAITLSVILLNSAGVRANGLGFLNAFAQSCGFASRIIAPVVSGLVWSSTLQMTWISLDLRSYINWVILGSFSVLTFLLSTRLNPAHYVKAT